MKEVRIPYSVQDPTIRAGVQLLADKMYETRLHPIQGELPKSEREIDSIQKIDRAYQNFFNFLGIPDYPGLPVEQFHAVRREDLADLGLPEHIDGNCRDISMRIVYVKPASDEDWNVFEKMLIHEATHALANNPLEFNPALQPADQVHSRRGGYAINSNNENGHLERFNEGMTEFIAHSVRNLNPDLFQNSLSPEGEELVHISYPEELGIVEKIGEIIARRTDIDIEDMWKSAFKGYFTGKPDFLFTIRRILGKNSLRILDTLIAQSPEDTVDRNRAVKLFILAKD